jgi:hypothetical protein
VDQIIIATTDPDKWIELSDAEPKGVATPVDAASWKLKGELALELGNLDRIAKDVAEYPRV